MKDIILYHGSKGGIKGNIQPASREQCDFGKGFYLGENPNQAKSIVTGSYTPVFYKIKLKLSEIPDDKILQLNGDDWLYSVLACRQQVPEFNNLPIAKQYLQKINSYDIVIGKIADDKMNDAMAKFSEGYITDKGLYSCLQTVQYGNQYVLKTPFACSKIEILDERILTSKDFADIQNYNKIRQMEASKALYQANIRYRNKGKYLDQIIAEQQPLLGIDQKETDYEL